VPPTPAPQKKREVTVENNYDAAPARSTALRALEQTKNYGPSNINGCFMHHKKKKVVLIICILVKEYQYYNLVFFFHL
jgi:F420-dependent methylenetetrahydromethanopterin dehydrogenase